MPDVKTRVDGAHAPSYTRLVSSAQVAADYIRSHRASESDGTIRAALAAQGFEHGQIDEAFALAGPRSDEASARPALSPQASLRLRVWLIGGGVALALLAALLLPVLFWEEAAPPPSSGVRADAPGLHAFLPPDLADADAAEDYVAILASASQETWAGPPRALTTEQLARLDLALTKSRSTLGARIATPGLDAALAATALRMKLLYAASRALGARSAAADAAADAGAREAALRREVLLGWHFAQDCDVALQNVGMGVIVNALGRLGGDLEAQENAVREVDAYVAAPSVVRTIRTDAADPAKLAGLLARLSDAPARRAYGQWTLAMAATSWSAAEIALARPAPERVSFFAAAAALDDGLMRRLAPNFDAALDEMERRLGVEPAGKRAALAAELNAAAAQGADLPLPR